MSDLAKEYTSMNVPQVAFKDKLALTAYFQNKGDASDFIDQNIWASTLI